MGESAMKKSDIKVAGAALVAGLLAACSMTLAVRGAVPDLQETFSGTATGYMDGGGNLTIISNQGATCKGNFVYVTHREGEGVISCNDGRTGPFKFVSTGTRGTGYGELGGKKFTFTFGGLTDLL
jgi:hypothetical protein